MIKHDISSENIDTFKYLQENIKWDNILPANSPDKAYETFHFIFSDLYDTAVPKRDLQISSKQKQRLYEKSLKIRTTEMKLYIRSINIYLKKLRRNLKQVIISAN